MNVVVGDVYEDIFLFKKYEKIWNFSSFLFLIIEIWQDAEVIFLFWKQNKSI